MTGLIERLKDVLEICKTDKRVWSAAAFVAVVGLVSAATGSWRGEEEKQKLERIRPEKPAPEFLKNEIANFQRDLDQDRQYRAQLGEVLKRAEGDVASNQKQVDWTFNSLVDKLDNMANRVDELANRIGSRRIEDAKTNSKIDAHKKKKSTIKRVDPNEL